MRLIIARYIKDTYKVEYIAEENAGDCISINESFVHDNQKQIWIIGMINNPTREIRLEISENRNSSTIKKIILNLIPKGNNIVTDGFMCYRWLDDPFRDYEHSMHKNCQGDFGTRLDSTSQVGQLFSHLKQLIKTIYISKRKRIKEHSSKIRKKHDIITNYEEI